MEIEEEAVDERSGYSMDVLVKGDGVKWAVEVDGPSHFVQVSGRMCICVYVCNVRVDVSG